MPDDSTPTSPYPLVPDGAPLGMGVSVPAAVSGSVSARAVGPADSPGGPAVLPGSVSLEPAGIPIVAVDPRMTAAHAAGRREALAEMAAWHERQETYLIGMGDRARLQGRAGEASGRYALADVHAISARHAKALAAAADDPAGPLPVRVRYGLSGLHADLRVSFGPEHGGEVAGWLVVRATDLPALRAGWPGAAFVEETPRGAG